MTSKMALINEVARTFLWSFGPSSNDRGTHRMATTNCHRTTNDPADLYAIAAASPTTVRSLFSCRVIGSNRHHTPISLE